MAGDKKPRKVNQDQLNKVLKAKNTMFNGDVGKLMVYDKTGELGFVVGPIDLNNTDKYGDKDRVLLVVITDDNELRVRYAIRNQLSPVENYKNSDISLLDSDLHNYCNKQCIFECGKDCFLYKYKKKRNENK